MSSGESPVVEPLDALLAAAHAVSPAAQVHIRLVSGTDESPLVSVVVMVGGLGGAAIVTTDPLPTRDAIRVAMEKMSGISTRVSAARIRQLLEEARSKP